MNRKIFQYLSKNQITETEHVNRIIINVFTKKNYISASVNSLITDQRIYKNDNDYNHIENLIAIIDSAGGVFSLEELIQFFEFVVSPSDRVVNGAIYTPKTIRQYIVNNAICATNFHSLMRVSDISCGCAGFLLEAALRIKEISNSSFAHIYRNNLFGLDIEEYSVKRAKILLTLAALLYGEDQDFEFNILTGNALTFDWKGHITQFSGFDVIIGNPPYVCSRNLAPETKQILSTFNICKTGHPDLYIPFFQIGVESLIKGGTLGFITMNSFFKSLNCRELRKYFHEKSLDFTILDFGAEQVFKSRNTYTCICIIKNTLLERIKYSYIKVGDLSQEIHIDEEVTYVDLDHFHGWNLRNNKVIKKIETTGKRFSDKYKTSHGLATLKNDVYIFSPSREDDRYYYCQKEEEYKIEKDICKDVINSNKLSRNFSLAQLKEKLLFPYSNDSKPILLQEALFKKRYPYAYKYLSDHKELLAQRDKGKRKYLNWYAFGRTQALEKRKYKLFFPKYSDQTPFFLLDTDENTYFYNGQAVIGENIEDLQIIKKILESKIFWFYITSTSKPYHSSYYSLNGTYINNFGVCDLTNSERNFILETNDQNHLDDFFKEKYGVFL